MSNYAYSNVGGTLTAIAATNTSAQSLSNYAYSNDKGTLTALATTNASAQSLSNYAYSNVGGTLTALASTNAAALSLSNYAYSNVGGTLTALASTNAAAQSLSNYAYSNVGGTLTALAVTNTAAQSLSNYAYSNVGGTLTALTATNAFAQSLSNYAYSNVGGTLTALASTNASAQSLSNYAYSNVGGTLTALTATNASIASANVASQTLSNYAYSNIGGTLTSLATTNTAAQSLSNYAYSNVGGTFTSLATTNAAAQSLSNYAYSNVGGMFTGFSNAMSPSINFSSNAAVFASNAITSPAFVSFYGCPTMYTGSPGGSIATTCTSGTYYYTQFTSNQASGWSPSWSPTAALTVPYNGLYEIHFTYDQGSSGAGLFAFISKNNSGINPGNTTMFGATGISSQRDLHVSGVAYLSTTDTVNAGIFVQTGAVTVDPNAVHSTLQLVLLSTNVSSTASSASSVYASFYGVPTVYSGSPTGSTVTTCPNPNYYYCRFPSNTSSSSWTPTWTGAGLAVPYNGLYEIQFTFDQYFSAAGIDVFIGKNNAGLNPGNANLFASAGSSTSRTINVSGVSYLSTTDTVDAGFYVETGSVAVSSSNIRCQLQMTLLSTNVVSPVATGNFSNLNLTGGVSFNNQFRDGSIVLFNNAGVSSNATVSNYNYYGFGMAASTMKYNVPANASHVFYTSNVPVVTMSGNSLTVNGTSPGAACTVMNTGYDPVYSLCNAGSAAVTQLAVASAGGQYMGDAATNDAVLRNFGGGAIRVGIGGGYSTMSVYGSSVAVGSASLTANLTCSGTVTQSSDARLKTDLKRIRSPLGKVRALTGYTYERTDDDGDGGRRRRCGLLAQDVDAVLPEVVDRDQDGFMSVAYGDIVGLLVEAIKDLDRRVSNETPRTTRSPALQTARHQS